MEECKGFLTGSRMEAGFIPGSQTCLVLREHDQHRRSRLEFISAITLKKNDAKKRNKGRVHRTELAARFGLRHAVAGAARHCPCAG